MTCFWNALIHKIKREDLRTFLGIGQPNPLRLFEALRKQNVETVGMKWQGEELSPQFLKENVEYIRGYDVPLHAGTDCGSCNPFLLLVGHLLRIRIINTYMGHETIYDPPRPRYTIHLRNNKRHMS